MKFKLVDNSHWVSDCGRYIVCVGYVHGRPVYQAWLNSKSSEPLFTDTDRDRCGQACIDHAAGMNLAPEVYQPSAPDCR